MTADLSRAVMNQLPHPVRTLTLAEIQADWQAVLEELRQGGAVLVEAGGGRRSSECSPARRA